MHYTRMQYTDTNIQVRDVHF